MPRHVRVEFDVPEDLVDPSVTDADLAREAKEDLVLRHFQAQRVSSGAAAEILGITRRDFFDLLARRGMPYFDGIDLDEEIAAAKQFAEDAART